jgi:sulfur carrier protein
MPTFIINGEPRQAPEGGTLADLVDALGAVPEHTALMLEGRVVPRADWADVCPEDGAHIEMIVFAGGG